MPTKILILSYKFTKIIAHFCFQLSALLLIFCEALLMYLTTPLLRFTELFFFVLVR